MRQRAVQSVPLVEGTDVPSIFTASRKARATPLNDASITWWPLRPESDRMCSVIAGGERERPPELLGELGIEGADPLGHRVDVVDEEGPAREVERHLHERLVERNERPTRSGERRPCRPGLP